MLEQLHLIKSPSALIPLIASSSLSEPLLVCAKILAATLGPSHKFPCCFSFGPFDNS